MSRTQKGTKAPGQEYWASRFHRHGETPGVYIKDLTHRKERRAKKRLERQALRSGNE